MIPVRRLIFVPELFEQWCLMKVTQSSLFGVHGGVGLLQSWDHGKMGSLEGTRGSREPSSSSALTHLLCSTLTLSWRLYGRSKFRLQKSKITEYYVFHTDHCSVMFCIRKYYVWAPEPNSVRGRRLAGRLSPQSRSPWSPRILRTNER